MWSVLKKLMTKPPMIESRLAEHGHTASGATRRSRHQNRATPIRNRNPRPALHSTTGEMEFSPSNREDGNGIADPSKPFKGVVICCTSIPPDLRVGSLAKPLFAPPSSLWLLPSVKMF